MSHAYRLGDGEDHSSYPILSNVEGRSSSSSVASDNRADHSTDGVFAAVSSGEGQNAETASSSSSSSSSSSVTLNLKTLTGQVMSVQLPSFEGRTVLQLKQAFESAHGIPAQLQRWIWSGRELNDAMNSSECRFENGCTIHLLLRQNAVAAPVASPVGMPIGAPPQYAPAGYQNGFPGMAGVDAAALEGGMGGLANISAERIVELQRAFQLARALRIFAIIDAIILLLWALSFPPFAVGVVLCLFGYYGATNARMPYMMLYLVYLILAIGLRLYLVAEAPDLLSRILFIILTIIEIYILRMAVQFVKYIKSFTEAERSELVYMIRPYSRPMMGQYN